MISKTVFKELAQFFVLGKQWFVAAFVAVSLIGCEVVEEPLNTNFEIRLEALQQREGDEGSIRVGDQFEIAVYNTETGQKDSSAALSDDNQSFQADEYTWTLTEQSVAALELEQGYDNTLSVSLVGEVTIEAKNSQNTASLTIEISPALLQSVEIQRDTDSFIWGLEKQLQLLGNFSDGTTQLLTENVDWSVSNEEITSITSTGLVSGNAVGQVTVEAVVINEIQQNIADAFELDVTAAAVKQLTISGSNDLPQGRNSQLTVIATYTNDTTANLSDSALWATDSSSVSLSSSGVATALELGSANISASIDNGYGTRIDSNSHPLTISDAVIESLSVIPNPGDEYFEEYSVAIERSRAFVVNARYSNGIEQDITSNSGLSLTSNDESALNVVKGDNVYTLSGITVSDSSVIASITNRVNETISVTQDISIYKPLLIQLSLTSSSSTQILGNTVQYSVFGTYHDGSNGAITENINWSLSNSALASISASGSLSTLGVGDLTVTATVLNDSEQEINDEIELTITPAAITKIELVGSDDIALGRELQIQANATYTDGTTQDLASSVTWQLSDDTVAAISETGLLTTSALGNLQLTGSIDDGYGNTISSSALSIQVSEKVIESLSIKATNEAVKTNPLTIAIEKTEPFIVEATYSNKDIEDITAREALTVSSSNTEFAEIKKSEAGTEYNVSTLTVGATTLTASINNRLGTTITESVVLNVNKPLLVGIEITPVVEQYALGLTTDWQATGVFEDETRDDITESVTWSSSDSAVAAFNNDSDASILTSITIGNTSITASLVNDFGDEITSEPYEVVTTRALLTGISLQPQDTNMWQEQKLSLPQGASTSLLVVGSYTDGTSANVTDISWSLGNESLASLDTTDNLFTLTGSTGEGNKGGTTLKATATEGESTFESEIDVTVIDPKLESFAITLPEENGLWQGYQQSYLATGTFSDSSTQNITSNVVWSIPDEYKSNISFAGNSKILLNAQGSAGIEAEYTDANYSDQVTSESISFSISGALLESITINTYLDSNKDRVKDSDSDAVINEIAKGQYAIVTATGSYSDGTTNDLTSQVTWTSSDDSAFSIDSDGKGTTLNSSDTDITITASLDNDAAQTITSTYTLTATPAIVQSVDIVATIGGSTVVPSDVPAGENIQLQVRGYYSDNTRQVLSGSSVATWATSNAEVATVDSATGLVTMVGTSGDFVNITATETVSGNSYSDSITLDVANAIIKSMKITPDTSTDPWNIALGSQYQMKAYAVYSDSSEQEITTDSGTGWSVPDVGHQTYISVNNSDIKGLVTGESEIDTAVTVQATSVDSEGNAISATADVIVGAPILELIEISPTNTSMIEGDVLTFTATGYTSDDRFLELSDTVTWSTSDSAIAEFNQTNDYDLFAKTSGTVEVIASYVPPGQEEISTTTRVTIDPATLRSIAITPTAERYTSTPSPKPLFLKGSQDLLTATGTYSNGSTKKINGQVTWDSTAPSVATISSVGLLTPVSEGETTISATIDIEELGSTKTVYIEYGIVVQGPLLEYIEIAPLSPTTTLGLPIQFSATGFYSDDTSKTLTDDVTWQVGRTGDDPSTLIGSMTSGTGVGGVFTPSKNGFGPISASINDFDGKAVSKQTFVTIDDIASLSISNTKSTIYAGQSDTFTVKGTTTGGKELTFTQGLSWSVTGNGALNNSGEASSNALVTSSAQGSMTITATWTNQDASTVSTSTTVTIENPLLTALTVTNANSSVKEGRTSQLTATATYSDSSTANVSSSVSWFTSNSGVASIDANGLISTSEIGSSSIYASTVNAASSTIKSSSIQFTVEDAVLDSISLDNTSINLPRGQSLTITPSGTMTDSSSSLPTPVTWSSSDNSVAVVDSGGTVQAVNSATIGATATITASAKESLDSSQDITATATVTIGAPVLSGLSITSNAGSIPRGTSETLTVSGVLSDDTSGIPTTVSWSSSNTSQMTINSSTGEVTVLDSATLGTAVTISASAAEQTGSSNQITATKVLTVGSPNVESVTITNGNTLSVPRGTSVSLGSSIVMSDSSSGPVLSWSSSNTSTAIVTTSGRLDIPNGATLGSTATITLKAPKTANSAEYVTDTLIVTVAPALLETLTINSTASSVPKGTSQLLSISGTLSDNGTGIPTTVSWSSNNANVTVNSSGLVSVGNSAGVGNTATITAQAETYSGSGVNISKTYVITVADPILSSLAVDQSDMELGLGQSSNLSSTGTLSDTTNGLPTGVSVTWSSSNTSIATVTSGGIVTVANSTTIGSQAVITASAPTSSGASTQKSSAITITVGEAVLESVTLSSAETEVPVGTNQQLSVTGSLSNGTSNILTTQVWSSSDETVATVDSSGLVSFKVDATPTETVTITMQALEKTGSSTYIQDTIVLTAGNPILSSLSIDTTAPTIGKGDTLLLTKTGTLTDNSNGFPTTLTWTSSNESVATVDSNGVVTILNNAVVGAQSVITLSAPVETGSSTTVSDTLVVTAGQAVLESITLSASSTSVPKGKTQQVTSVASLSDSTSSILTTQIWSSSDTDIATVDSSGLVTIKTSATAGQTVDIELKALETSSSSTYVSDTVTLTVEAAVLTEISIDSFETSVPRGDNITLAITGTLSDGTTGIPAGVSATWSSLNTANATINSSSGLLTIPNTATIGNTAVINVSAPIKSGSSTTVEDNVTVTVGNANLASLAISSSTTNVAIGKTLQLSATGTLTDGNSGIPTELLWSSGDTAIATVDGNGLVTVKTDTSSPNTVVITAKALENSSSSTFVTETVTLTIDAAEVSSIEITNSSGNVPRGTSLSLTAQGTLTSGANGLVDAVSWSCVESPCPVTLAVDGTVTAENDDTVGDQATIKVTTPIVNGSSTTVEDTFTVTITNPLLETLSITEGNSTVQLEATLDLSVTGTLSDNTTTLLTTPTWSSDNADFTVDSSTGLVTVLSSATDGETAIITVSAPDATGSSNNITASVTITAQDPVITSIVFDQADQTVPRGTSIDIVATANLSNGNTLTAEQLSSITGFTWSTSASADATVTSVNQGASGALGRVAIPNDATKTNTATITLTVPEKEGSGTDVTNSITVTVGEPELTVTLASDSSSTDIPLGQTITVEPTFTYSDGASVAAFSASDLTWSTPALSPALITLDTATNHGEVQAIRLDDSSNTTSVDVELTSDTSVTATIDLTVVAPVIESLEIVASGDVYHYDDLKMNLTPVAIYSDKTTAIYPTALDWSASGKGIINGSSDTETATGIITIDGTGTGGASSTVTATDSDFTKSIDITFASLTIAEIQNGDYYKHTVQAVNSEQMSSYIILTNDQLLDLSAYASLWSITSPASPDATISTSGSIDFSPMSDTATVNVIATTDVSGNTALNTAFEVPDPDVVKTTTTNYEVEDGTLVSLEVYPRDITLRRGKSLNLKVYGVYSYSSTPTEYVSVDVTHLVTWTSGNTSTLSNAGKGLATATGVTYTASIGAVTSVATVDIVDSVSSISISGAPAVIHDFNSSNVAQKWQLTATANFSGGYTEDITEQVTWVSSNTSVATISNAPGTKGLLTSVLGFTNSSSATYTAQWFTDTGLVSATTTASSFEENSDRAFNSITVSNSESLTTLGQEVKVNLTAAAVFASGSNIDVTDLATWTSSHPTEIHVSNKPGQKGQITTTSVSSTNSVTISATMADVGTVGTYSITRTDDVTSSIAVTPLTASLAVDATQQFTATASYTGDSGTAEDVNVTSQVVWVSSDPTKVYISNAPATKGLATRLASGDVTITAYFKTVSSSTTSDGITTP